MILVIRRLAWTAAALVAFASPGLSHEMRPAYLQLRQSSAETFEVLWKVPARGEDLRFGLYARFPDSTQILEEPRAALGDGAHIERWTIRSPDALTGATVRIVGLENTLTDVLVRIERLDGGTQVARVMPDSPSFVIEAAAAPWQVARTYLGLGVEHILLGFDHLLFVFALLLLVRGWRPLLATVTSFTVAHSLTLAAATLGWVRIPVPPVEACIALSIAFVAAEIVRSGDGQTGLTQRQPWLIAFVFGLLHGLGFAGALSEVGLPPQAIPLALLFFNVGVELGQLSFIAVVAALLAVARRRGIEYPPTVGRLLPTALGGIAMFLVIERTVTFLP